MTDGVSEAFLDGEGREIVVSVRVMELARAIVRECIDYHIGYARMYPEDYRALILRNYGVELGDEELEQLVHALRQLSP